MKVIAVKTLKQFIKEYPKSKQAILSWYEEAEKAVWGSPNDLKKHYHHASIISDKRVVFNLHGNTFRLGVDIEYRLKIVFVVWFGTHTEYDRVDIKKITYDKANKK